jgi:hypothetical protein
MCSQKFSDPLFYPEWRFTGKICKHWKLSFRRQIEIKLCVLGINGRSQLCNGYALATGPKDLFGVNPRLRCKSRQLTTWAMARSKTGLCFNFSPKRRVVWKWQVNSKATLGETKTVKLLSWNKYPYCIQTPELYNISHIWCFKIL